MSNPSGVSPFAGTFPKASDLIDVPRLLQAYEADHPDAGEPSQGVHFGTSGHRGSSLHRTFNRDHILAISQAICIYRKVNKITGPLFLGFDTHALSRPAFETTLEVLAANAITVMVAPEGEFTPTPVISHAILTYNKQRTAGHADGIVITPSHNPPGEGGFKYNPPHGGPAEKSITDAIQNQANEFLKTGLKGVLKIPYPAALKAGTTHLHDYLNSYVRDLENIIDMDIIRDSRLKIGVDPLGGAGVQYWQPIADFYRLDLNVLNTEIDPSFRFMTRDWDGQIRMDPSSKYAMQSLIKNAPRFDVSFACDTDHDRHGIVTKSAGLMPANQYLAAAIYYLYRHRPLWSDDLKVGKTLVSSQMIDRVSRSLKRTVYEVPVGFKWFVEGLLQGELGFAGEESAGASFLRKDGSVWTTDKDGFIPGLLAAEMTARQGKDPAALYRELELSLGRSFYTRVDAPASAEKRAKIGKLTPEQINIKKLAGEPILNILTKAPGNGAGFGGIKIETENGWLAARPSGTEDIYKIYAESFVNEQRLKAFIAEGQEIINQVT